MSWIYLQALSEANAAGLEGNTAKFHLCPGGYENGRRLSKSTGLFSFFLLASLDYSLRSFTQLFRCN